MQLRGRRGHPVERSLDPANKQMPDGLRGETRRSSGRGTTFLAAAMRRLPYTMATLSPISTGALVAAFGLVRRIRASPSWSPA